MKWNVFFQIILAFIFTTIFYAQDTINEENAKTLLTKIFDLSKDQNYSAAANYLLNSDKKELKSYNFENSSEAKNVKRMIKKIKAYLDLSDAYEYESLTFKTEYGKPSADLKVNFRSGDQKLTISFLFVKVNGKLLLDSFK